MSHLMQKKENIPAELGRFRDTGCGTMQAKKRRVPVEQRQDAKDRRRERYVVTGGSGSFIIIYLGVWGDFRQDAPKEAQKTACAKKIIAFLRRGLHWRGQ